MIISRYTTPALVIATIILAAGDPATAASPSASIVSPASPLQADQLQRLEFVIQGTDADNDLRFCRMYVGGVSKGYAWFDSPNSGATARWTYAFSTPGPHSVQAQPVDAADNRGTNVTWNIEVTNLRQSLELSVLTYNTHLFQGVSIEFFLPNKYEDDLRRDHIIDRIAASGADIVGIQELWAHPWQQLVADALKVVYPYSAYEYTGCSSYLAGYDALSNGLLLLSKWPLSQVDKIQTFPTYDYSSWPGNNDTWANQGVLPATVDIGGLPLRIGISHALTGTEQEKSNWLPDYVPAAITTFQHHGQPYIFALRSTGNEAHIRQIEDYSCPDDGTGREKYGVGWKHIYSGTLSSDYRAIVSFHLNGHPHLFALKSGSDQAYIMRINDDPSTGWRSFGPYPWDKDCNANAVTSFQLNGQAYIFALRSDSHRAELRRINTDLATGEFNPSEPFEDFGPVPYNHYFHAFKSFESNGRPWLYGLKSNFDQVYLTRINEDPSTGKISRTNPLTEFGPFEGVSDRDYFIPTLTSFQLAGRAYIFGIKTDDNQACLFRINADPSTGLQRVGDCDYWLTYNPLFTYDNNYIAARAFQIDGHPYLFALQNCCHQYVNSPCMFHRPGQAWFKRINDDGSGWQDLYQLEDLRIIRDATVLDENSPPAVMMGDFNVHRGRYGIMDQLFRKAGAVDAYMEVHGTAKGGETINIYENSFAKYFYLQEGHEWPPDDPDFVDRIDYVYVKQSGAGLRLLPTEAYVIRDWTYPSPGAGGGDMDLSDHYPVVAKFRLEGGCPVQMRSDFNCDRFVNLSDLAILWSAWLSGAGDGAWNRICDIADPADDFIDTRDFVAFAGEWGALPVHNVTQHTWSIAVQTGIDDANDGDEIEVAPGTYKEAINFRGKAVRLYSSGGAALTTIDTSGLTGAYHVVQCVSGEDADTVLEGFTIAGGHANGTGPNDKRGAGMINYASSPTVIHCRFEANHADVGGGMANYAGSSPTLIGCTFVGNLARAGAAMANYAGSSPRLTDCVFTGNIAREDSGGMSNHTGCNAILLNCTFTNNAAVNSGGGMQNAYSSPTLNGCTFSANTAGKNGGAVSNRAGSHATLTNCTFRGNTAGWEGAGMYNHDSNPTVTGCSFNNNDASSPGGLRYEYYRGSWDKLPDFDALTPAATGRVANFDLSPRDREDNFAFRFSGFIYIPSEDTYRFYLKSDDGSKLYVDGTELINNDGLHKSWEESADLSLNRGNHRITVLYFNGPDNLELEVSWSSASWAKKPIAEQDLYPCGTGGGMCNYQSSPTVTDCTFCDNEANGDRADMGGGGMRNWDNSNPTITNCSFLNNKAGGGGAGMDNRESSNPSVTNCTFSNNLAGWGSAMFNGTNCSPTATNCTFSSNSAAGIGGGMYNLNNSSPTLTNCTFSGNSAGTDGGGMGNRVSSNPSLTNCTFSNNYAKANGGAIDNYYSTPTLTNCILWDNTAPHGPAIYGDAAVTCSDIQGGWADPTNINADPLFVDALAGDLRLSAGSPCIDKGSNAAVPPGITTDLNGSERICDGDGNGTEIVDMGAYEFTSTAIP